MFNTFIYQPLYNGIMILLNLFPWMDAGTAIIVFTIIIKLILFPLSYKATLTQVKMKEIQPELDELKKKYPKMEDQAPQMMELYKKHNIKPFSGILPLLIQIPIIFGLYFIFLRGGLETINFDLLYSFVAAPGAINHTFLGIVGTADKSIILAVLVGLTQFIQYKILSSGNKKLSGGLSGNFQDDFVKTLNFQMQYILPVVVGFISYTLSAAIALYWITSNLFAVGQEIYIKSRHKQSKTIN